MNINDVKGYSLTSQASRKKLANELQTLGIKNTEVINLVSEMPRHLFIDSALTTRAYENVSLPIGFNQTISQPYIVAKMTELIHEMTSMENVFQRLEQDVDTKRQYYRCYSKKSQQLNG